jgi:dynein heavy chain
MLDGDLDANWIESMNSVMDDNRMLTLASNERIPLKAHMRMIFEIRDLQHATPATVSRAGVVYLSADDGWQWRALVASWLMAKSEDEYGDEGKAVLGELLNAYTPKILLWLKKNALLVLPMPELTLVDMLLRNLDCILDAHALARPEKLEYFFVFAAIWSFGGALTVGDDGTDYRKKFSEFWRSQFKSAKIPSRDMVYDYYLEPRSFKFELWQSSPFYKKMAFDSNSGNMADGACVFLWRHDA